MPACCRERSGNQQRRTLKVRIKHRFCKTLLTASRWDLTFNEFTHNRWPLLTWGQKTIFFGMTSTPLWSSCWTGCLFYNKLRLSMEHQRRVRIGVPPRSEACVSFLTTMWGARCDRDWNPCFHSYEFSSSALRYPAIAKINPLKVHWIYHSWDACIPVVCPKRMQPQNKHLWCA